MAQEYIEERGGGYYFIGSRVSLDSVAHQFLQGESPEAIVQAFPSLSLLQIYGGITFYLAHQAEMDLYLKRGDARFEELARALDSVKPDPDRYPNFESREANPLFYAKLEAARRATPIRG